MRPDLKARIAAMPAVLGLVGDVPRPGGGFEEDARLGFPSMFHFVRSRLGEAVVLLGTAAGLESSSDDAGQGTGLLLLRPAMLATARNWWVVEPIALKDPAATPTGRARQRIGRAYGVLAQESRMGARAMQNASRHGGNRLFEQISERLVEQADGIEVKAVQHGSSSVPPPRDTELVTGLARGIDDYYGTVDAGADLQLFWHAASSLSHAERWYRALAASDAGRAFAQTLEERSFLSEGQLAFAKQVVNRYPDYGCSDNYIADLEVISLAGVRKLAVITNEQVRPNATVNRPRIPEVCKALSIDCLSVPGFLRREMKKAS